MGSIVTANANGGDSIVTVTTLGANANLVRHGPDPGSNLGSPSASGVANLYVAAAASFNAQAGQGTANGADGTQNMAIRVDMIGDTTTTGLGSGFLTRDSTSGYLAR